jgi:hypothetical protein
MASTPRSPHHSRDKTPREVRDMVLNKVGPKDIDIEIEKLFRVRASLPSLIAIIKRICLPQIYDVDQKGKVGYGEVKQGKTLVLA